MLDTTKGPYHCNCSFPCLSGWRMRTQSPGLMSVRITFLSLHDFVSAWYLSRFSAACSLACSAVSISTYRWVGVVAAISVRKDRSFSSSGVMASSPYSRRNGVKPVVLVREMLCPQTIVVSSRAHFPFGESNRDLDTAINIRPFAFSTAPLVWGWLTDVKVSLILSSSQKFLKFVQSNCFPLSTVMYAGTPNRQIILCQTTD